MMVIFTVWILFILLVQKKSSNIIKKYAKIDFCRFVMPSQKTKIFQFNQYLNSNKKLCIIYVDLQSFVKKIDWSANNSEKFSIIIIGEHIPCGYPISTIWAFHPIKNKHSLYRWVDCMEKACSSLRVHATNLINFERKKMLPLTKMT